MRTSAPPFSRWLPVDAAHRVGERQRVRVVGSAAAVAGAVDAHQAAGRGHAGARPLAGDAGVGDRAGQAERQTPRSLAASLHRSVVGAAL